MAEPTTPQEYRKGKTKIITLSSGHVLEIRKMSVPVFAEMFEALGLEIPAGTPLERVDEMIRERMKDPKFTQTMVGAILRITPHCWVRPRITESPSEDSITIDDIEPGDLFEAFSEIMDFSGISKMAEEMRGKFRV